jgi:TfoX/Sxy family transcriptional regulator of competence genes
MNWAREQVVSRVPKADLDQRDADYIRDQLPGLWLLTPLYFRADVRGLDRIPAEGPVPSTKYGEGKRAYRTAYDALKHSYEKVGDHGKRRPRKGRRIRGRAAAARTRQARRPTASTPTRQQVASARRGAAARHLRPRFSMNKDQLVSAIMKANRNATTRNR